MGESSIRPESTSKSDAKFEKKLQFYAKVRDTVALSTTKKITKKTKLRSRQRKLKAYDLSLLSESLPELKAKSSKKPDLDDLNLNCNKCQKLILKEGKKVNSFLECPDFQTDPIAAIHQHLESTQPVSDEKPKKKPNKNGSKKKRLKKALSGPKAMEV